MTLPPPLREALLLRFGEQPREVVPLSGSGGQMARLQIRGQRYIVKWASSREQPAATSPDPCTAEARGLMLLASTNTVRVPRVEAHSEAHDGCPAFLVIEWIDGGNGTGRGPAGERLGYTLAELHRHSAPDYGLDHDNYCGPTPQINGSATSWLEFFRARRLQPQMDLAASAGLLPSDRRRRLERLLAQLDRWIDEQPEPPSLIHGDLWGGNWLVDSPGQPVLIDPAVSYSHREAELAMCHLFGGFPPNFFAAYDEAWPPLPGRDERLPLYQLYHLLNHLNLFGEGYGAQVETVLRRYVG